MRYTQHLDDSTFDLFREFEDEEIDTEDVLAFLNNENAFRDFGEGLKHLTRKYMPEGYQGTEESFLKLCAQEKGISLARNTVKNWFRGGRPKKGDQSRENMFKIAFALGLSFEDMDYLFRNVYLDKPVNSRNANELIYAYCVKKGLGYDHASRLISQVKQGESRADLEGTIFTNLIELEASRITSDEEIVNYILCHPHNFSINNRTASKVLNDLLKQVRPTPDEAETFSDKNKRKKIDIRDSGYSYVIRELASIDDTNEIKGKYKTYTAIETMLDIITCGFTRGDSRKESGKNKFKNSNLPKEITNRFPIKSSFSTSPDQIPFEEIRKMIILLFSYGFWFRKDVLGSDNTEFDDYTWELDSILEKCHLQSLYYGNPYDWLFLFCTMNDFSVEVFREILLEGGDVWE